MIAAAAESPAYNAGLQPGDILSGINDIKIEGMKNFQAQVEKLHVGDRITVTVQRNNGKDEYKEIEFEVTVEPGRKGAGLSFMEKIKIRKDEVRK